MAPSTTSRARASPCPIWTRATIRKLRDEAEVRARVATLNTDIARENARISEGPASRLGVLDADAIVEEWRRTVAGR